MILMVPHQLQKCSPSRLCLCPVLLRRSDLGLLVALIFHAGSVRGGLSNHLSFRTEWDPFILPAMLKVFRLVKNLQLDDA